MSGIQKAGLVIGGLAAAGLAGWWYYNKTQAQTQATEDAVMSDVVPTATGGYVVVPGNTDNPATPVTPVSPSQPESAQTNISRPTNAVATGGQQLTYSPGYSGGESIGWPAGKIVYDTGTMNWTEKAFMAGAGRAAAGSPDLLLYGPDAAALASALQSPPPPVPFAVTPYPRTVGKTTTVTPSYPVVMSGFFAQGQQVASSTPTVVSGPQKVYGN